MEKARERTIRGRITRSETTLRLVLTWRTTVLHPWLSTDKKRVANFTDLSIGLAACCGVTTTETINDPIQSQLFHKVGGTRRRHIVLVLCDGLGTSLIQQHVPNGFLSRHDNNDPLRAVFPSTTPAALTTLATAAWPGEHGMPGWNLREQLHCDFPDQPNGVLHHLLILAERFTNSRTRQPVNDCYKSSGALFLKQPWANNVRQSSTSSKRRMIYVNAYNGDEFQDWLQAKATRSSATDFSSWQMGDSIKTKDSTLFDTATIGETSYETLGQPEGSAAAITYFRNGVDAALRAIAQAEKKGESTFCYLYTAHPDKHMHALGTSHKQVTAVISGIDAELERMNSILSNRNKLLSEYCHDSKDENVKEPTDNTPLDATLVVTADHGHITVEPQDMVVLPPEVVDCLEYANVGAFGSGRQAYLHCRPGLQSRVQQLWRETPVLNSSFILLTIDEAAKKFQLFGPNAIPPKARPRMGDFIAISRDAKTLVTPKEFDKIQHRRGAHGSLLPEEMEIPFITCIPT